MQIRKLDTTQKQERARFVDFQFELYKDSPLWVPPIRSDAMKLLDGSKHPFYEHSYADFYVVEEGDRVLGRIALLRTAASTTSITARRPSSATSRASRTLR